MSGIEIRAARYADRDAVAALLRRVSLPPDGLDEQFPDAYAVAEEDGTIVGAAGVEAYGASGLLRSVAVAPEMQGLRLGERLTRERLRWAGARGLETIYLLTTTAAEYFPRLGFEPVSRGDVPEDVRNSLQFSSVCCSSAAVLALRLGAADDVHASA